MSFKEKYKKEIDGLSFSSDFEIVLAERIKKADEGKEVITVMKKRKTLRLLVAVISAVLLLSLTAYAAITLLAPQDVADALEMSDLDDKWKQTEKFPLTSGNEEYTVSVLGYAPDTEMNEINGDPSEEKRTYLVVSVARTDGTPLSSADGIPLQISPFVEGYEPFKVNLWLLGSGANGLEKDGILYYLFETADLEIFADRTVYIAAYEGFIPMDALTMKEDGTIVYLDDYNGFKAIFELPLDKSKADPEAVKELLSQMGY
ncbi:MAG: hypothetical protein IJO73_02735 [Clostridia bacterium]|nr:hypothetical protein [Clostridia bacterium]